MGRETFIAKFFSYGGLRQTGRLVIYWTLTESTAKRYAEPANKEVSVSPP